jgi:hypothetical protein
MFKMVCRCSSVIASQAKKYRAIPFFDPQLVAAWRFYVISDGPLPRRPGPRRLSQGRAH